MTYRRVLIIRPSALGDVCRSVPVLTSLRKALPKAKIDWLVQAEFIDAVRAHPALNHAIPFARKEMAIGRLHQRQARASLNGLIRTLREPEYDLVIDCQGLTRSGLFARLTGARTRIGHADARELAWLHYTRRVPPGDSPHTVDRMLDLVRALDIQPDIDMRLHAPPEAATELPAHLLHTAPVILAPTSRWPGKRWPIDRFTELAHWLLKHTDHPIAVVGAGSERDQCQPLLHELRDQPRVNDLIGATTIGGLMHLISHSCLVVANDSAALHMAVGYDKPIVTLFGPTDTAKVGPYRRQDTVLQHTPPGSRLSHKDDHAGLEAMRKITTAQVIEAVDHTLRTAGVTHSLPAETRP